MLKELEGMLLLMVQFMKVNSKITKCMVMAVLFKRMVIVMKVNFKETRSMGRVDLLQQNQAKLMKDFG